MVHQNVEIPHCSKLSTLWYQIELPKSGTTCRCHCNFLQGSSPGCVSGANPSSGFVGHQPDLVWSGSRGQAGEAAGRGRREQGHSCGQHLVERVGEKLSKGFRNSKSWKCKPKKLSLLNFVTGLNQQGQILLRVGCYNHFKIVFATKLYYYQTNLYS